MKFLLVVIYLFQNSVTTSNGAAISFNCFQDISYQFDENTLYWPDSISFRFTKQIADNSSGFFYAANEFEAGEHGGTHIDAPYHFNKDGWKVGDIPPERLFVKGILIEAQKEAEKNNDYALPAEKLEEWERKNGPIPKNSFVVLNFGWAKKYTKKEEYFGSEDLDLNNLHFPGLSAGAAQWISKRKEIVGVGLDTPSLDPGNDTKFPAHIFINGANKYIIENLALNDVTFPKYGFNLLISPMKIKLGTGAPTRVYLVNK